MTTAKLIVLAVVMVGLLFVTDGRAQGEQGKVALIVHLCQANNSPYAFVWTKFKPREVPDPWAVRFFDEGGQEVPYFVWDLARRKVAREGRAAWGNRYARLHHGTGNVQEALTARGRKLERATRNVTDLGAELTSRDTVATSSGDSVYAAVYLLRVPVPPYGKEKLTLRVENCASAEQLPDQGFQVGVWNGLPWTESSFWYPSQQLGIHPAHRQAMWLRLEVPTWREMAELEVLKKQDAIRVTARDRMTLRIHYELLHPEWTATEETALTSRAPDGSTSCLSEDVEQTGEFLEWVAEPGQYVLSNETLPPLVDLNSGQTYKGQEGGLYPGGSNVRPAAHDAAGRKIARDIVPLDADGNPDPVNGRIVILPVSVSNAYGAWHRGDETETSTTFMTRANANPAKNPKLFIAYGFEYQLPGGNGGTGDPGPDSIFYKTLDHALQQQELTPKQVQVVWLSMPVSGKSWGINLPPEHRTFPADAQQSKLAWKEIVHAIHARYPNVKIIYSSTKGAMYLTVHDNIGWGDWNGGPIEPWNHDAAWGVKWVIEDQIHGDADLNYDPARGPVRAPWLSWGPYFWSHPDGTPRDHDGFVWSRSDVAEDGLHPSLSGLTKYATLLLQQLTTDPTATPWFLQPGAPPNHPPTIAKAASAAANPVNGMTTTLSVLASDDGGEPNLTYTWTCTGPAPVTFSENGPNRAKSTTATFSSAGRYTFQVMIGDAGGLTATSSIAVPVTHN